MTSSAGQSEIDIATEYRVRRPMYEELLHESLFSLRKVIESRGIKVHTVDGRVKDLTSFEDKVRRKGYSDPFSQAEDLVGLRIVTLFLSDLRVMDEVIHDVFDVISVEDKLSDFRENEFGYQSVHYIVTVKGEHTGPRYDGIKGVAFEVQVRTILMDAWANVSHYLDYKGAASIPPALRRSFFALSGLFYVADEQFKILHTASLEHSGIEAEASMTVSVEDVSEITLDELYSYLQKRYPGRNKGFSRAAVSEFLEELSVIGYRSISGLDEALQGTDETLLNYENHLDYASPGYFNAVGAARNALATVDVKYREYKYSESNSFKEWIDS